MKELSGKIFAQLHVLIFLYMLYGIWVAWDEHDMNVTGMTEQIQNIENETLVSQKRLEEIEEFIKKRDEYQLRVEEVAKNIESVQKQLPPTTNDSDIISFINQELNALNIRESNMKPGIESPQTFYISKDYNLTAKGTFLQFLIFFERIGNASRIYNVPELSMRVLTEGKKGRFQLLEGSATIQAYRYNPSFKVDRGFPTEGEGAAQ